MKKWIILILLFQNALLMSQKDSLPYDSIPDPVAEITPATVLARSLDGLGYRYYWATEGLTPKDLAYEPGNGGQSTLQVLQHIRDLTRIIKLGVMGKPNIRQENNGDESLESLRTITLLNIKEAASYLWANPSMDINTCEMIFQRGDRTSVFPVWNMINGPIEDAVYHTGQVVSFRRSAGNPISPFVRLLTGKNKLP